jgi:8-oxo-dGTP diphosphatase
MDKMVHQRRRGTAIVDTPKGILVAGGKRRIFLLPGGGAAKWESRRKAAIRELREETGLIATDSKYLFSIEGSIHKDYRGGHFKDHHKVFLIKATGTPRPRHEVKHIAYYTAESNIRLSKTTKSIIDKYHARKREEKN